MSQTNKARITLTPELLKDVLHLPDSWKISHVVPVAIYIDSEDEIASDPKPSVELTKKPCGCDDKKISWS